MGGEAAARDLGLRRQADLTGVVLCGGKSVRMGRDKAALDFAGATLLERTVAELASIASETLLACGTSERYAELGQPLALDKRKDGGPLAGLEAGLGRSRTEWVAAVACDMPRVDARVFLALLERARKAGLDACLLETRKGVEPLCAVYRRGCLAPIREALDSGERRVTSFFRFKKGSGDLPKVGVLPEDELPVALAKVGVAVNVNTPEDLSEIAAGHWAGLDAGGAP